nr:ribonuclease H-like domain, reverse transcriptase, RNA-dependent DNA polymerase [Tanacetum cinerariifolium]
MAMLTMRAIRFLKKTGRKGSKREYEQRTCKEECDSGNNRCKSFGLESVEARLVVYRKNEDIFEENIKILKLDIHLRDNALTELRKKLEKAEKEIDEIKITLEKFENSSKTLNKMLDSQVNDKSKTGIGYHAVRPPYTGNFMPSNPDLILADVDELKVNTARQKAVLNAVQGNQGNLQLELQEKGVIDSGFSRHMTGNMSYLFEYKEIDGGYIAFGGDPKGGKITGKGKISTDIECVVLSCDFKPLDESQVLLRVSRMNNMYSVDLKNVAPSRDHLGKFDGKADEGFFVGYSVHSKAFRVFNSRTRIVEETLHITFLENKPNVAGNLLFSSRSMDSPSDGFKPLREDEKKDAEDPGDEGNEVLSTKEPRVNQEKDGNVNNSNNINTVIPTANAANTKDNAVDKNIVYGYVGEEADMINLDTNIPGYTQEEGIDYDEVFTPVTRIEAIRLFLAYALFKDFVVYQMDVKSAFIYGKIEEEVYVCQPLGFEYPEFPDRVYKVERHYIVYIKLLELGQPKLGLWYPKDSPFDLEAYTNTDYAGASLDRKSTTGGCQFLGSRLISWQCKKQTVVANSTTKAELYTNDDWNKVKELIRMELRLTLAYTYYCQLKVNVARHKLTTIVDVNDVEAQEEELGEVSTMPYAHQHTQTIIQASTSKPQKKQKPRKPRRQDTQETQPSDPTDEALYEENVLVQSIDLPLLRVNQLRSREDRLKLKELMEIYTNLQQRRLEKKRRSRTHGLKRLYKISLSARVESSAEEQRLDEEDASKQERNIADIDADAETTLVDEIAEDHGRYNDQEMFDTGELDDEEVVVEKAVAVKEVNAAQDQVSAATTIAAIDLTVDDITLAKAIEALKILKPKIRGIVVRDHEEPSKSKKQQHLHQLLIPQRPRQKALLYKSLVKQQQQQYYYQHRRRKDCQKKALEANIAECDDVQAMMDADYELAARVKRLEKKRRSRTHGLKRLYKISLSARVESSAEEQSLDEEDASKQERNIADIDADAETTLVDEIAEDQGRYNDQEMFDTGELDDEEVVVEKAVAVKEVNAVQDQVSAATTIAAIDLTVDDITLAKAIEALKILKPKIRGIVVRDHEEPSKSKKQQHLHQLLIPQRPRQKALLYKSLVKQQQQQYYYQHRSMTREKEKMVETEMPLKKKAQISLDEELAFKLQDEQEEEEKIARKKH